MNMLRHPITGKEMPEFLTGVITPMLTALNEDLSLDEAGNRSLVRWYKDTGAVTTIFARSGVGQMFTYSFDEVKSMIDTVTSEAKDDIYVMPGTSGTFPGGDEKKLPDESDYIEEALTLSTYAEDKGATAVVVLPLGLTPSRNFADKVFGFYQKIDDAVEIPIVIYQPPGVNPPYSMTPALLHRLADLRNLKGMKFSTSDMQRFGVLCAATADQDFTMVSGHEGAFLPSIVLGAGGVIGGGCNTHPELIRAIFDAFMDGDMERARRAQFEVSRLLGTRFPAYDPYSLVSLNAQKLYLARKGVKVKPFQRGGQRKRLGEQKLDTIEKAIDEAIASLKKS